MTRSAKRVHAVSRDKLKTLPRVTGWAAYRAMGYLKKGDFMGFHRYTQGYGRIFEVRLGSIKFVVLTTRELAKEAYDTKPNLCPDRGGSANLFIEVVSKSGSRMVNNGAPWLEIIHFDDETLFNPEFVQAYPSTCAHAAADQLADEITNSSLDVPVDPTGFCQKFGYDVLFRISFGRTIDYSDPEFSKFTKQLSDMVHETIIQQRLGSLVRTFPSVVNSFLFRGHKHRIRGVAEFLKKQAMKTTAADDQSLIELFRKYLDRLKADGGTTHAQKDDDWRMVMDFYLGAAVSFTKLMGWHVLYMAYYTDVQQNIRDEMKKVLGGRPPNWEDKDNLPYTHSTLLELMRIRYGLTRPHFAPTDGELDGYFIGKGSVVFASNFALNFDPEVWDEPEIFNPRRFLNTDGQIDPSKTQLLRAFGIGRRRCTGMHVAKISMFLHLTRLVHHFDISLPAGHDVTIQHNRFQHDPEPFQVIYRRV